jgi:hypothetical protein
LAFFNAIMRPPKLSQFREPEGGNSSKINANQLGAPALYYLSDWFYYRFYFYASAY